jgi:SpoVK/Ycf46/Vps4 family AAA+-type ATPase
MTTLAELIVDLIRAHESGNEVLFVNLVTRLSARLSSAAGESGAVSWEGVDVTAILEAVRRRSASAPVGGAEAVHRSQPATTSAGTQTIDIIDTQLPSLTFDALELASEVRAALERVVVEHRSRELLRAHGLVPASRLLLVGPPGTGKTVSAAALAGELDLPLRVVRSEAIVSRYLGETASRLREVFEEVTRSPGVYLFDEFDVFGAERSRQGDVAEMRRVVNALLVFLEGAVAESLVVAATNHPGLLDRALFRRFDIVCCYLMPDAAGAVAALRRRMGALFPKTLDTSGLAEHLAGLSYADLITAAEAVMKAVVLEGRSQPEADEVVAALDGRRQAREIDHPTSRLPPK